MFRNKLLLCLLLLSGSHLRAQDFEADLNKVMRHVDSAKSVSLAASVNVYSKKGGSSFYSANASLKKSQGSSWTVLDDLEYYTDKEYSFVADHDERRASVLKSAQQTKQEELKGLDIDMKQFKKLLSKEGAGQKAVIKLVSSKDDVKIYAVTNIPTLKEMQVTLNMKKLSIVSLSYEYTEKSEYKGQYIVVSYTRFDTGADLTESLKQSNFFTVSNGKATLNQRFKGYTLHTEL